MRKGILGIVALALVVLVTGIGYARDLEAENLAFYDLGGGVWKVTGTGRADGFDGLSEYSYTMTIEHWRSGLLLETVTEEITVAEDPEEQECTDCEYPGCSGQCSTLCNTKKVNGTCAHFKDCPNTWSDCECDHKCEGSGTFQYSLLVGDVVTMTVSPESAFNDEDPTNNVLQMELVQSP